MSNPFDAQFEELFGKAWSETGAEPMDYYGPDGTLLVEAVPVTFDQMSETLDGGEHGGLVVAHRMGSAFRAGFNGVVPLQSGRFQRSNGQILRISQPPGEPDSAGEYRFDFGA